MVTSWPDFHWTSKSPDLLEFNRRSKSPFFCLIHLWSDCGQ